MIGNFQPGEVSIGVVPPLSRSLRRLGVRSISQPTPPVEEGQLERSRRSPAVKSSAACLLSECPFYQAPACQLFPSFRALRRFLSVRRHARRVRRRPSPPWE